MTLTVKRLKGLIKESIKSTLKEGFGEEQEAKGKALIDVIAVNFNKALTDKYKVQQPGPFFATNDGGDLRLQSESQVGNQTLRATVEIYAGDGGVAPAADARSIDYKITIVMFGGPKPITEVSGGSGNAEKIKMDLVDTLEKVMKQQPAAPAQPQQAGAAPAQQAIAEAMRRRGWKR